jgi:hypothetical protein
MMMEKWSICGYVEMETKVYERMGKIVEGLSRRCGGVDEEVEGSRIFRLRGGLGPFLV